MSKIRYRIRERTPSEGMSGTHSVYAEVVPAGEFKPGHRLSPEAEAKRVESLKCAWGGAQG